MARCERACLLKRGFEVAGLIRFLRRTSVYRLAVIAFLLIGLCDTAQANFTCGGKVTYLGLFSDGTLTVGVNGYGPWYICNNSTASGTFSPETCRSWYAMLLATQKA